MGAKVRGAKVLWRQKAGGNFQGAKDLVTKIRMEKIPGDKSPVTAFPMLIVRQN